MLDRLNLLKSLHTSWEVCSTRPDATAMTNKCAPLNNRILTRLLLAESEPFQMTNLPTFPIKHLPFGFNPGKNTPFLRTALNIFIFDPVCRDYPIENLSAQLNFEGSFRVWFTSGCRHYFLDFAITERSVLFSYSSCFIFMRSLERR